MPRIPNDPGVPTVDTISELEREWPVLATGELARALPTWRRVYPVLARFDTPARLLSFLQGAPSGETDAPLHALLSLAARDGRAARVCLQAILPAIKSHAARIVHRPDGHDELRAVLLASAWEAVRTYPLRRRHRVAANLVLQVLHDATREARRLRPFADADADAGGGVTEPEQPRMGAPGTGPPSLGVDTLLANAGIAEAERELILLTRIDGVPLARLAASRGVSYGALLKRRQRAEARLRASVSGPADVRNDWVSVLTWGEGSRRPRPGTATVAGPPFPGKPA